MSSGGAVLRLSWRGLRARPARSALTALGVAVAAAGLTVLLSLGAGLRRAVEEQVDSVRPQVQVSLGGLLQAAAPPPTLPEAVFAQVEAQRGPLALRAVTPVVLHREARGGLDVTFFGAPAGGGFARVYPRARVARGRSLGAGDEGAAVVVIGARVAERLRLGVGDRFALPGGRAAGVIGVLAPTGTLTDAFVVAPLRTLQGALGTGRRVSLAAVEVPRDADVPRVVHALEERVDAEVYTQLDARRAAARRRRAAAGAQWALAGVALVVAFLSVLVTLTAAGHERRAELGVLRALGLRPALAAGLLLLDGVLLSGAGGALGALLGGLGAAGLGALTEARLGVRAAVATPGVLATVLAVAGLGGALAALPVAWRAGRGSVARALRAP